jgi:nuclear protein localization family protein 4
MLEDRHGDLLFVGYKDKAAEADTAVAQTNGTHVQSATSTSAPVVVSNKPWQTAKEDPVDVFWEAQDGKIPRKRDRMCRHGDKSMCDHCMPLEVGAPTGLPVTTSTDATACA